MTIGRELKFIALGCALLFVLVSVLMRKGERIKGVAFFVGWLVPGAGHVLLGKWKKGLFFFLILAATYAFGMHIAGWRPVSFDDNPFYFVGQYGSGATLLIAKLRGAEKAVVSDRIHPSWFDPGLLYVCVVGLLNLVIMLNVLDLKAWSAIDSLLGNASPAGPSPAPSAAPATPVAAPPPGPEKTA